VTAAVSAFVLTAGLVAHATGGRLVAGAADRPFSGVSTDTRTLQAGALFLALRGERFDGHAFISDARRLGAAGLLLDQAPKDLEPTADLAVIVVPDTLEALQALGRDVRRRSHARVVAITGSAGKTTTKEVAATLLATTFKVFRNRGNLNNHIGLPLSLVELCHGPDVAVVELGMNHAGEIRTLVRIAEPDMRVWTNVGDAHIGHFGTRDAVADAKAEIFESAGDRTVMIVNADDPLVMARAARLERGRVVTFGESPAATVRAVEVVDRGLDGTDARVDTPAGSRPLHVPLPGRPHLSNVLAAMSVALEFGVPLDAIVPAVASIQAVARRGAVTRRGDGTRIVDDSYNASPAAMRAMLAALAATASAVQRVAMLGEMLELGDQSYALHEATGRAAASAHVDTLVVVGGSAADGLVDGAVAAGLRRDRIHRFAASDAAAAEARTFVSPGDVVLVKGSRGTRMDLVVDRLLEEG